MVFCMNIRIFFFLPLVSSLWLCASFDSVVGSFALGASTSHVLSAVVSHRLNQVHEFPLIDPDCVERKTWFVASGLLAGAAKALSYEFINRQVLQPLAHRFSFLSPGIHLMNNQLSRELFFIYMLSRLHKRFVLSSLDEMGYRPYLFKKPESSYSKDSSGYLVMIKKLVDNVQRNLMANEFYPLMVKDAQEDFIISATAGFHLTEALLNRKNKPE